MAYEEEVIKLIFDLKDSNTNIKDFKEKYARLLQDMERDTQGHVTKNIREYRKQAEAIVSGYERVAKARKKLDDQGLTGIEKLRRAEEKAQTAAEASVLRQEAREARAEQRRLDRIERRANTEARLADAQYSRNMAYMYKMEQLEARAGQMNIARLGRMGAGIAGMTGNYQAASGLYAASNAAQLSGATISGGAALAAGGVAGLALAAGAFLMHGRELNIELAKMSTLLLPASAGTRELSAAMDDVAESAVRLSGKFGVDAVEVVKAYKEALSSGIDAGDLERFGKVAGTLSVALGEDFGKSVSILTTFKDTYGASISDLKGFSDILFNIVNVGKVNTAQLLSNFGRVQPIAAQAGISIRELSGAFSMLSRQMTVPQATTSLGRVIENILNPSEKAKKVFNELGIVWGQAAFAGGKITTVLEQIASKVGKDGGLMAQLFPEIQSLRGISVLSSGVDKLRTEFIPAMDEASTATVALHRAQNTLWADVTKLISGVSGSVKVMGSDLANVLNRRYSLVVDVFRGNFGSEEEREDQAASASGAKKAALKAMISMGVDATSFMEGGELPLTALRGKHRGIYEALGLAPRVMTGASPSIIGLGKGLPASQMSLDFPDELKAEFFNMLKDSADKKTDRTKVSDEAKAAAKLELASFQEETSKELKAWRENEIRKKATSAQEILMRDIEGRKAGYSSSEANRIAKQALEKSAAGEDPVEILKWKHKELQTLRERATIYDEEIANLEELILSQKDNKIVMAEESDARKEIAYELRKEARQDKHDIELEKQNIRKEAEQQKYNISQEIDDLRKSKSGAVSPSKYTLTDGTGRKYAMDKKTGKRDYEDTHTPSKSGIDAKIDALEDKKRKITTDAAKRIQELNTSIYDIGTASQEASHNMVAAANNMTSTATATLAAASSIAAAASIVNNAIGVNVSVNGGIDGKAVGNSVAKGIEKAKRNGTLQSDYQKTSPMPRYQGPGQNPYTNGWNGTSITNRPETSTVPINVGGSGYFK